MKKIEEGHTNANVFIKNVMKDVGYPYKIELAQNHW